MAPQKSVIHKKDIKVLCTIRNLSATMTVYGFESYIRSVNSEGKPVKQIIPAIPLAFEPGADVEDGYTVAYVSDTAANRLLLKSLVNSGTVICDSPIMDGVTRIEKLPTEIAVQDENELNNLRLKNKAELLTIADGMKLNVSSKMTNEQLIAAITVVPE